MKGPETTDFLHKIKETQEKFQNFVVEENIVEKWIQAYEKLSVEAREALSKTLGISSEILKDFFISGLQYTSLGEKVIEKITLRTDTLLSSGYNENNYIAELNRLTTGTKYIEFDVQNYNKRCLQAVAKAIFDKMPAKDKEIIAEKSDIEIDKVESHFIAHVVYRVGDLDKWVDLKLLTMNDSIMGYIAAFEERLIKQWKLKAFMADAIKDVKKTGDSWPGTGWVLNIKYHQEKFPETNNLKKTLIPELSSSVIESLHAKKTNKSWWATRVEKEIGKIIKGTVINNMVGTNFNIQLPKGLKKQEIQYIQEALTGILDIKIEKIKEGKLLKCKVAPLQDSN